MKYDDSIMGKSRDYEQLKIKRVINNTNILKLPRHDTSNKIESRSFAVNV